jgi:protoporphyrinogen/coproporphyrinogen III oxidase
MAMDALPVIVVGAGPGGLAAAWRLQRAGHRVKVLEAAPQVGGRMQSVTRDGYPVDRAATIIPDVYHQLLGIVAEAGLSDELVPAGTVIGFAKPDGIHYLDSDRLYLDAVRTRILSPRSKLMMLRMMWDNRRLAPLMSYEDLSVAAGYDTETAAAYAARRTTPEIAEYVVDATIRGVLAVSATETSVLDFFFSFTKVFGSKLLNFRDGLGSYPRLLAAKFDDLTCDAEVLAVRDTGPDVEVTWRDRDGAEHVERAAGCVLAVPPDVTARVATDLDPERRRFLAGVEYTSLVSINAGLAAPPAGVPAFFVQVPASIDDDLFGIVLEHHKVPGRLPAGKGAITAYCMSHASARLAELDDERARATILAKVEKVLGPLPPVEWIDLNRWPRVVVRSYPGYYREVGEFLARGRGVDRRVRIAGDFLSSSNTNTATASGERAARELIATLAAPATVPDRAG